METVLYIAHAQQDGTLPKIAKEVLTVAVDINKNLNGSKLVVGLLGSNLEKIAQDISGCSAEKYIGVEGENFTVSRYSSDSLALEEIIKAAKATIIIAPGTSRFNRVLPGLAFRLSGRIDTHICGFEITESVLTVQRWYYRQRMIATLSRKERPWFLVVDSQVAKPYCESPKSAALEKLTVNLPSGSIRTKIVGEEAASSGGATIKPDANLLFVTGAGWSKKQKDGKTHVKEAENIILNFLDLSKASLGSSKSLVDQKGEGDEVISFLSHINQVGQTGSSPRHPKGLATCCHGEEPHAVGWRFINERRAINLDPNCGWVQGKADVVYVADAFEVMSKINKLLLG